MLPFRVMRMFGNELGVVVEYSHAFLNCHRSVGLKVNCMFHDFQVCYGRETCIASSVDAFLKHTGRMNLFCHGGASPTLCHPKF